MMIPSDPHGDVGMLDLGHCTEEVNVLLGGRGSHSLGTKLLLLNHFKVNTQ